MALIYTTIQHSFRKSHSLTINEYTLTDMVYHLSNNVSSNVPGWCYMSKQSMADELDFSKRTVINLTQKMIDKGFIEKHPITRHLRTTIKWQNVYFTDSEESSPTGKKVAKSGAESSTGSGAESSHNNNTNNTNINNFLLSEINISEVPLDLKEPYTIALSFQKLIIYNLEQRKAPAGTQKKAKFKKWVDPIRLMLDNDGVTKEHLSSVYSFLKSPKSSFWQSNILSTTSLRKNISKVLAQAGESTEKEKPATGNKTWLEKQKDQFQTGLDNLKKNNS